MDEKIGHAHVERTVGLFLRTSSGVKRDEDFFGLVLWLANTSATSGIALMVGAAETITTPATLRVGRTSAQIGYNRRLMKNGKIVMAPNPKCVVVPWLDVLAAYGEDDRRIAVLFSYAVHPVIVTEPISAEYPGYAIKHLRNLLSKADEPEGIFMFAQGCGGNINDHPLWSGFGARATAGLSLAFAVTQALNDDHTVQPGQLNVRSLNLSLPLEDPPPVAELKECKKRLGCSALSEEETSAAGDG